MPAVSPFGCNPLRMQYLVEECRRGKATFLSQRIPIRPWLSFPREGSSGSVFDLALFLFPPHFILFSPFLLEEAIILRLSCLISGERLDAPSRVGPELRTP